MFSCIRDGMNSFIITQAAVLFLLSSISNRNVFRQVSAVRCNRIPNTNCACELDNNGGTYDLSVLYKNKLSPLFTVSSGSSVEYSYDPCLGFSYGESCRNVAGCKTDYTNSSSTPTYRSIADFDDLRFVYNNSAGDQLTLIYTRDQLPIINTSVVLACDAFREDPILEVRVEGPDQYGFLLTSSICGPTQPSSSISFGTFLCIVVPVIFFAYFTFGFLYLFLVKHETWANAVPHHEFWFSLPGLIKDGALFTWYFITGGSAGSSTNGYDQI